MTPPVPSKLADNGTAAEPIRLPDSFQSLSDEAPADIDGMQRLLWLTERLSSLPDEDRQIGREAFDRLARQMVTLDASDLDLGGPASREHAWFRVDGNKNPYPELGTFKLGSANVWLLSILTDHRRSSLLKEYGIDYGYSAEIRADEKEQRYRITVYVDNGHLALCMRLLAWKPRPLEALGFHRLIERGFMFRHVRDGLTLFTGVTGSGKSTTLDAIVDANNKDIDAHILIVAQPLEYIHTSEKCIIRHREVGTDVANFVDGMVQGLRQDPDIVVVGEMRDPETISTAMEMADTGHKIFSTLHTGSAIETIDRIVAEYPPEEQARIRYRLADVLRCVVSQKLLPSVSGGRVLAKEVLWLTPASRAAIKNGNTGEIYQMIWQGRDQGMTTLEQDLARLVSRGEIRAETALSYSNNKRRLLQLLKT